MKQKTQITVVKTTIPNKENNKTISIEYEKRNGKKLSGI
jgi:hypothetical protein